MLDNLFNVSVFTLIVAIAGAVGSFAVDSAVAHNGATHAQIVAKAPVRVIQLERVVVIGHRLQAPVTVAAAD